MDIRHFDDADEMHVFGTNRTKVHYFTCKLSYSTTVTAVFFLFDVT